MIHRGVWPNHFTRRLIGFTSFHWPWLITDPQALDSDPDNEKDKVYGPKDVKAKALEKNTYANSVIADAYAVTGLATSKFKTPTQQMETSRRMIGADGTHSHDADLWPERSTSAQARFLCQEQETIREYGESTR